jgi:hypothetical protein
VSDGTAIDRGDVVILGHWNHNGRWYRLVVLEGVGEEEPVQWIPASTADNLEPMISRAIYDLSEDDPDDMLKRRPRAGQKGGE